jgi:hypothetical protein
LEDIEKLRHLIDHWIEHNEGHSETYRTWTGRAASMDRPELAAALGDVVEEAGRMGALLRKAREAAAG